MHSIFDFDDDKSGINIAKKISMCSTIEVSARIISNPIDVNVNPLRFIFVRR